MVVAWNVSVAHATLLIAVYVANRCRASCTVDELRHSKTLRNRCAILSEETFYAAYSGHAAN